MQAHATVTLANHGLELRCSTAGVSEDRQYTAEDVSLLQSWASRYQELARTDRPAIKLLRFGEEIHAWLNGREGFLDRLLETAAPPLLIEFGVGKKDTLDTLEARVFLDAPWELLASDGRHWALSLDAIYCPIRRIGKALQPPARAPHRLSLVFMAAAPRGADKLNYEAEEAAILTATRDLGLDLVVEESGTLDLLSGCVARERPHAIQISCHGMLDPEPGLLLEDEVGDRDFVTTTKLIRTLGAHHPRLLFLSACETAEADPVLDSLARSLTRSGAPAVLGWAAPVRDVEATLFAAGLHSRVTAGEDLAHALAYARLDLAESEQLAESTDAGPRSRDWHLARLYLNPTGGGALATAGGPRRLMGGGRAVKTFLDTKGNQVPVAGEREFVGRRRETQAILRAFRASGEKRPASVFVHGLGRQGKSSLAARVARRLEHTHDTIVIYRRYDGPAILTAFRDRLGTSAVTEIVNRHLPEVERDKANLLPALRELLEGPCNQKRKDANDHIVLPVLVVIDDFEQALEVSPTGPRHSLRSEFVESIRAVIKAFNTARTESRLMFTSRYRFTLPDGGTDLADRLHDVPLHGMDSHESRKQATAKLRAQDKLDKRHAKNLPALLRRIDRIIGAARGNPGLQDILFSLCLEAPEACDRCLAQMEDYAKSGTLPVEDQARQFLENLAIGALLDLLSPAQRELLRTMTLFEMPAPTPVVELLAQHGDEPAGEDGPARLIALGLCEVYEDLHDPAEPALAVNSLVRPLAGALREDEHRTLAALVAGLLFERWGGETGTKQRSYGQDYELTRLALLARDARVLTAAAALALRSLDRQFAYQQAASWAVEIMAILDAARVPASVDLLQTAAEGCQKVGEVATAATYRKRALAQIVEASRRGETTDPVHHAATLVTHARALNHQGEPDKALELLEQARAMLPRGRDQAVVMSDVAQLRADKGEVEAAQELLQEALPVFEMVGDNRSRAGVLRDIARLQAHRGEVDAALRLLQEVLAVHESLGDKPARAVTLGDIAQLWADKGEVDAALKSLDEARSILEGIGDKRSRAGAVRDIARLRAAKGEVEAALELHREVLAVYETLEDKRERAITLGDIARLRAVKGDVDAAIKLHDEALAVFVGLGDNRARAATLVDISRLWAARGEVDAALELLQEALAVHEAVGDKRARAVTLGDIARLRADKGEVDAARTLHLDRLADFEAMGHQSGISNALWSIARIEIEQQRFNEAAGHLAKSYEINLKLGRLDGICFVGLDFGRLLCAAGRRDAGLEILTRSRDGFEKLGRPELAAQVQAMLDQIAQLPAAAQSEPDGGG